MDLLDQENERHLLPDEMKFYLANAFLNALKTHDWDLLSSILTQDVTWTLPGASLISGRSDGVEEVVRKAQRIVSFHLMFRLNYILYGLNGMALSLHKTAARGDMKLDEDWVAVCDVRDNKITAINTYSPDVDLMDAFFGVVA